MIFRRIVASGFVFTFAFGVLGAPFSARSQTNRPSRNFEFTYLTRIPPSPLAAKTLTICIPLPTSHPYQAISVLTIESHSPSATHPDPQYATEYLYLPPP